jgi:hypothetical protein
MSKDQRFKQSRESLFPGPGNYTIEGSIDTLIKNNKKSKIKKEQKEKESKEHLGDN